MRLWQDVFFSVRTMCRDPVIFLKSPLVHEERLILLFFQKGTGKGWSYRDACSQKRFQDVSSLYKLLKHWLLHNNKQTPLNRLWHPELLRGGGNS